MPLARRISGPERLLSQIRPFVDDRRVLEAIRTVPRDLFVPPSGHVAGVYARVENREGVGRAPANEPLDGVVELEFCIGDGAQSAAAFACTWYCARGCKRNSQAPAHPVVDFRGVAWTAGPLIALL